MQLIHKILVGVFTLATVSGSALAGPVVLNFEGISNSYPSNDHAQINNFYNGGTSSDGTSGINYGITFSPNAHAFCLNTPSVTCSAASRGGFGDPTSQEGALQFFGSGNFFIDDSVGFDTGFSFFYVAVASSTGSLSVFSDLDGTGTTLATLSLPIPTYSCSIVEYCPFAPLGVSFTGTAKSISFAGVNGPIAFDDVTFGSATPGPQPGPTPEPSSLVMMLTAFGAGITRFRRHIAAARA